jgi:uncharacterized protein YukE
MSSLDEVFDQMRAFQQSLKEFNDTLRFSASSLAKTHEEVSGLWRDTAAAKYQLSYQPLAESLENYIRSDAPRFERFLENKVRQLEHYLTGE